MQEKEQSKPKRAVKMVRCPEHVHSLLHEVRALMSERGHQAYWLNTGGKVVHGNVKDAPLHIPLAWALEIAIEILHPDRNSFAAAHQARENYLESFEEEPEDGE